MRKALEGMESRCGLLGAVDSVTRALAVNLAELAPIRMNTVRPGPVVTDLAFTPLKSHPSVPTDW